MYCRELAFEFFCLFFIGVVDFSLPHRYDILISIGWDDHISHIADARYGFSDFGQDSSIRDPESEIEGYEPEDDECDKSRC